MKRKAAKSAKTAPKEASPAAPHASLAKFGKAVLNAFARLGIQRELDLVLHLPHRYDDETHICRISEAPHGQTVLVEGAVTDNAIKYRPKRQLVCTVEDESGVLVMRFLNFYTSQVRQLAPGTRVRLFGEIRQGFFRRRDGSSQISRGARRYARGGHVDAGLSDSRRHYSGQSAAHDTHRTCSE